MNYYDDSVVRTSTVFRSDNLLLAQYLRPYHNALWTLSMHNVFCVHDFCSVFGFCDRCSVLQLVNHAEIWLFRSLKIKSYYDSYCVASNHQMCPPQLMILGGKPKKERPILLRQSGVSLDRLYHYRMSYQSFSHTKPIGRFTKWQLMHIGWPIFPPTQFNESVSSFFDSISYHAWVLLFLTVTIFIICCSVNFFVSDIELLIILWIKTISVVSLM